MSPRSVLIPAVLLLGVVLSVASSGGPAMEDFANESLEHGPAVSLVPGQTARFRLHFVAPIGVGSSNNLLLEFVERPLFDQDSGIILDTGLIVDSGAPVDTGSTGTDTGGTDTAGTDTGFGTGTAGTDTGLEAAHVHLRMVVSDQVMIEEDPLYNLGMDMAQVRWFGVLDACSHLGSPVGTSLTPWFESGPGMCEGTMVIELTVDQPETIFWGARLKAWDQWQPCDANGEPAGCLTEEPDPTVRLEILPA